MEQLQAVDAPDWQATVDGSAAIVRRADQSLISVDLPAGAREVELVFNSTAYAKGKAISLAALLAACVMIAVPLFVTRRRMANRPAPMAASA